MRHDKDAVCFSWNQKFLVLLVNFQGISTSFFIQFLALLPIAAADQNRFLTFLIRICTIVVFFVQFSRSGIWSLACCFQIHICRWTHFFARSCCSVSFHTWCRGRRFCSSLILYPKLDMTHFNLAFAISVWIDFSGVHVFVSVCISRVLYLGSGL